MAGSRQTGKSGQWVVCIIVSISRTASAEGVECQEEGAAEAEVEHAEEPEQVVLSN